MMFSIETASREYEISGLKPMEIRMYDLAWSHNKDGLGFAGLVDLWFKEISPHITLAQVHRVFDRLSDYGFFHTNKYYEYLYSDYKGVNDYVPSI